MIPRWVLGAWALQLWAAVIFDSLYYLPLALIISVLHLAVLADAYEHEH